MAEKSKRTLKEDFRMILRGYKLLWTISPRNFIWRIATIISNTVASYFGVYMSALIINKIAAGAELKTLLIYAAITVFGGLLINLLNHFIACRSEEMQSICFLLNELHFLKAQCHMQYKHLEDPETALLRQKIRDFSNYGGHGLMTLMFSWRWFFGCIIDIIMSVTLTLSIFKTVADTGLDGFLRFVNSPYSALVLLLLIFGNAAINYYCTVKCEKACTNICVEENKEYGKNNNYMNCLADNIINGSIGFSLDRMGAFLKDKTSEFLEKIRKIQSKQKTVSRTVAAVNDIALFIFVGAKAFIGTFGIGNILLYRETVSRFVSALSNFGSSFAKLRINNDYMEDIFRFLELPDDMYKGTLSVEKRSDIKYDIEFRNVSFKYPGSDTYALKNVSFKFNIGEKLAIVGMNGSGKTTFVKLLCRLYDPTEGQIFLRGIDISKYNYDEYIKLFSVVFQDYAIFGFSLGNNIAASENYDKKRVLDCIEKAGLGEKVASLENGLETAFGKLYQNDGVEFSGGESQKIAIARALYKNAPFIILDEPTASLDPIAEADIYARFNNIVSEKTAIFISHRLSSCRFADKILVFDNGTIINQGTHDELVSDSSTKYHELWNAQAQYYTD